MKRPLRQVLMGAASICMLTFAAATPSHAQTTKAHIAIVVRDVNNPYWRALRDGAIAEGHKLNVPVSVEAGANETDALGENAKISTMANEPFNCFGVVPVNGTNIITPLIPISQKGIPIIDLDAALDPDAVKAAGLKISSYIGADNHAAGEMAATYMLGLLNNTGNVAILEGTPGEHNGILRETAFREATAGKFTIVQAISADYERSKALTETEDMLRVHPDLAGIFAANDEMGLGAAQAIANAGKQGKIKVVSIDGVQEALESVASNKLSGTVSQYPYAEGEMAVQACVALVAGKPVPAHITAPIKLITPENAQQALKSFPRPFFSFSDPFGTP